LGATLAAGALVGDSLWSRAVSGLAVPNSKCGTAVGGQPGPYGPLLDPDENGIMLPRGFRSRVVARGNKIVEGTDYRWHLFADGGATFRVPDGGWVYVSNSETPGVGGGASSIRFDSSGKIASAQRILGDTRVNCAGGATPWGTWLSCEEFDGGHVWECDPLGVRPAVMRPALGTFRHEAVAVDPNGRCLYLTEDIADGAWYRFVPAQWGDLSEGVLEVASVDATTAHVEWLAVPRPNDTNSPTRSQVRGATPFKGAEGIAFSHDHVYFVTKTDGRVWDYDVHTQRLGVLYEARRDPVRQITGADNIASSAGGDLFVAEDGGNMELVLLTPDRIAVPILRIVGQDGSEIAGPAFDPWRGDRLYFSSQRGDAAGITYEVTGPFRRSPPQADECG
jgi:secreted PhoX family phosphatase